MNCVCVYCGKTYIPKNRNRVSKFCSRECYYASKRQHIPETREDFINKSLKIIKSKNRYVPQKELVEELNISESTLNKFNVSVIELNKLAGYDQPILRNKKIKCKYCGKEFTPKQRSNKFCSVECRNRYHTGYVPKSREELVERVSNLIIGLDEYVTFEEISDRLDISSRTFYKYDISVPDLNEQLGYIKPDSIFEEKCGEILSSLFKNIEYQKTFEDCLSPKKYHLRFDFFIPTHSLLIEADGTQHFNKKHWFTTEYNIQCDLIKQRWCKEKGYSLIRIPYSRNISREQITNIICNYL